MTNANHLLPEFQEFLKLSSAQRIGRIQDDKRWVDYPCAESVFKTINNMLAVPDRAQAPCLLVYGDGGTGKSSIVSRLKGFPRFRDKLIYIELSVRTDNAKLPKLISESLGAPYDLVKDSRASRPLPIELEQIIKLRGIKGIILDELHDAFLVPRLEQQRNLSLIKGLTNHPIGVSIFGFGTSAANNSIKSDAQFYRRFNTIKLEDWKDSNEFRSFMAGLESQIPLRKPSFLDSSELCGYVLERTGGRMDSVVRLIRAAACHAISSGEEAITPAVLRTAFSDPWGY